MDPCPPCDPRAFAQKRDKPVDPHNRISDRINPRENMGLPGGSGLAHTETEEEEEMQHEDYCAVNEIGLCSCRAQPGGVQAFGPWIPPGSGGTGPTLKELADDEAVHAMLDVNHLESAQEKIEKLKRKGIVLCRAG